MTFDDDLIRFDLEGRKVVISLKKLKIEWPPPQFLLIEGKFYERISMSALTDEQRGGMTHVRRGADYRPTDPDQRPQGRSETH